MKSRTFLALLIGLAVHAHARTWTSSDGRTLDAEFVSATATEVTLRRARDGKTFTLELSRLCEADREFAAAQSAQPPQPPANRTPVAGEYAKLITGSWQLAQHGNLPYAFFGPTNLDGSQKLPLVVVLHYRSSNNENGKQTGMAGPFVKPDAQEKHPCLVLSPLCYQPYGGTGAGWAGPPGDETLDLIKKLVKKLPAVDADRIYVVGHSLGGFGTWRFLKDEPKLFAAGIPIAGGASDVGRLKSIPIWAFHGAKDNTVSVDSDRRCAEELKHSKVFHYTEFPDAGHNILGRVLGDPAVIAWLFDQRR